MTEQIRTKVIDILLVEDNLGDVRLTREALKEGKVLNTLYVVGDGIEALEFLKHKGQYVMAPYPDIILLDLNLPRMDGRELLANIKTTSKAEEDILMTYDLHANCFITKPVDMDKFITVIKSVEEFWFTIVKLPPDRTE
jgi:chemotaxis family two-component system response regulator Rcp1